MKCKKTLFFLYLCSALMFWSGRTSANADASSFAGLKFGIGLALTVPFDFDDDESSVREALVDGNGIVRTVVEEKRSPRLVLESHFFFNSNRILGWDFCPGNTPCAHGPYVAIEAGGADRAAITAYSLGWMLGFKRNADVEDLSSWNIGFGYVVRTPVKTLADGIKLNEPLDENDELRYKDVSQPGLMFLTSFTF